MRPLLRADVVACARALLAAPCWSAAFADILARAAEADRWRRAEGRLHPRFGDGSLEAATQGLAKVPEPAQGDRQYCACLAFIYRRLAGTVDNPS
ncbi:MAG: hypothetical protein AAGE18_11375 [Pseudomonadota bacterium]